MKSNWPEHLETVDSVCDSKSYGSQAYSPVGTYDTVHYQDA